MAEPPPTEAPHTQEPAAKAPRLEFASTGLHLSAAAERLFNLCQGQRTSVKRAILFNVLATSSNNLTANKDRVRGQDSRHRVYYLNDKIISLKDLSHATILHTQTVQGVLDSVVRGDPAPVLDGRHGSPGLARTNVESVVDFLQHYAKKYGLPCPDKKIGKVDDPVMFLPCWLYRRDVYCHYVLAFRKSFPNLFLEQTITLPAPSPAEEEKMYEYSQLPKEGIFGFKLLELREFLSIWRKYCNHIKIRSPTTDYCNVCLTEKDKQRLDAHRAQAQVERDTYLTNCSRARASQGLIICIGFDFAQALLLPILPDQPGDQFWVTSLKADMFGLMREDLELQINVLLEEGLWTGKKSANEVCSMLFYAIKKAKEENPNATLLLLNADNCVAQNKNRWNMWFFALMAVHFNLCIILNTMVVGHTKSHADGNFGTIKKILRKHAVTTTAELITAARGTHDDRKNVFVSAKDITWQDWKSFLDIIFSGTVPKVTSQHQFEFDPTTPGFVTYKKYSDSSDAHCVDLFNTGLIGAASPEDRRIIMAMHMDALADNFTLAEECHLSDKRREYLEKKIFEPFVLPYRSGMKFSDFASSVTLPPAPDINEGDEGEDADEDAGASSARSPPMTG